MRALIINTQGRGRWRQRGVGQRWLTVGMGGPATGLPMLSRAVRHRHPSRRSTWDLRLLLATERAIVARRYDVVFGCSDGEI
jgi:hypothetical protein